MSISSGTTTRITEIETPKTEDIGKLARSGANWVFARTIAGQILNIVTTAVLARYLAPDDYGIMGMVATLTGLLGVFAGLGLALSTVQRANLTAEQLHNIFWINAVAGFAFWGVCIVAAPWLASFYDEPKLIPLTIVLGASFAIGGLGEQSNALLHRAMKFRQITIIQLVVQVVGAVVAIAMAIAGWGYWSLAVRAIVAGTIGLILTVAMARYRPGRFTRGVETWSLVTFGGFVAISSIVTYFAQNTDNIIVGRVWGAEELGYYSRAYFLMTLPTILFANSVAKVVFPALSALAHDAERQAEAYRKSLRAIVFGGLPAAVGLAIAAPEAVRLIYGPEWGPVVPILAWLSAAMATTVIGSSTGWLYMVRGRSGVLLGTNVVMTAILLGAIAIGARHGVNGVAAAHAVSGVVLLVPSMYLAHRVCGLAFGATARTLWPIVAASAAMGILAVAAGWSAEALGAGWLVTLGAKVAVGTMAYGAMAVVWLRPLPLPIPDRLLARMGRFGAAMTRERG